MVVLNLFFKTPVSRVMSQNKEFNYINYEFDHHSANSNAVRSVDPPWCHSRPLLHILRFYFLAFQFPTVIYVIFYNIIVTTSYCLVPIYNIYFYLYFALSHWMGMLINKMVSSLIQSCMHIIPRLVSVITKSSTIVFYPMTAWIHSYGIQQLGLVNRFSFLTDQLFDLVRSHCVINYNVSSAPSPVYALLVVSLNINEYLGIAKSSSDVH